MTAQALDIEADSDEESFNFSPLDTSFSYAVSELPPSLEVVPTIDMEKLRIRTGSLRSSARNKYGCQEGDSINTRHVRGEKVGKKHAQYALSAGMVLGVRECVGGMSEITEEIQDQESNMKMTLEEECLRVEKYKFPEGFVSSRMKSLPYRYKFKAYAPRIFSKLRSNAGIEKQRFLHSICGNDEFIEFISNAKSGQFFFYSHDGRYMIKTQTQEEKTFLRHILPRYYSHMKENPHSFVTHFYGMYRVQIPDLGKSIHFVIMKSVFNTEKEIHKIWDLKGSTKGRRAKRGDSVHKDLDIKDEGRKIHVGTERKEAIMDQLRSDTDFLAELQIMDYSLLVGVHLCTGDSSKVVDDSTASVSTISTDDVVRRRAMLQRTNTPMRRKRRKSIIENGYEDPSMPNLMDSSKSPSWEEQEFLESDDDSDSDLEDIAESLRDIRDVVNEDVDLTTTLSALSYTSVTRLPNPFTSREDLGIESFLGRDSSNSISREFYFCGIIDILQFYNTRKWGETIMRRAAGNSESAISCVSPVVYADRFLDFMSALLE